MMLKGTASHGDPYHLAHQHRLIDCPKLDDAGDGHIHRPLASSSSTLASCILSHCLRLRAGQGAKALESR